MDITEFIMMLFVIGMTLLFVGIAVVVAIANSIQKKQRQWQRNFRRRTLLGRILGL